MVFFLCAFLAYKTGHSQAANVAVSLVKNLGVAAIVPNAPSNISTPNISVEKFNLSLPLVCQRLAENVQTAFVVLHQNFTSQPLCLRRLYYHLFSSEEPPSLALV